MRDGKDDWESSHNLHGVLVYILIYPWHCLVYWRLGRISGNVNEKVDISITTKVHLVRLLLKYVPLITTKRKT